MNYAVNNDFEGFPKIPRFRREVVITEKIDGTNAAVVVTEDGRVYAQSRTRVITPEQDNHGFARWVENNRDALAKHLGPGRHFGEWWGQGINRGYGLTRKYFSLFNVKRWGDGTNLEDIGVSAVPVIVRSSGSAIDVAVEHALEALRIDGSIAAPGYDNPEGIVIFHTAANQLFKVTLEHDDEWKGKRQ